MNTIKSMRCEGLSTRIELTNDEVIIDGWKKVPYNTIQQIKFYPILESAPANGGCLKLVTSDNPILPVRDGHSFNIPETDISAIVLSRGNCFWFKKYPNINYIYERIKAYGK